MGWWLAWALAFIASLLPPIVHHWRQVAEVIEPLRYPTGFLPAELLFLRYFGEVSPLVPVALVVLGVFAIYRRSTGRACILGGVLLAAIFSSLYAAYSLTVLSMYLVGYSDAIGRSAEPSAAHEPPPAAAVRESSEPMNPKQESEAPDDGGGR